MRVLYHLLRFIKEDYYDKNASSHDKRKFSPLVRSAIPNNVLFLIALNASITHEGGKDNSYGYYQFLLHYFNFFEHALFFSAAKSEFVITEEHVAQSEKIDALTTQFFHRMHNYIATQKVPDDMTLHLELPLILSWIYMNHLHKETRVKLTGLQERLRERYDDVHQLLVAKEKNHEYEKALLKSCFCYLAKEQNHNTEALREAKETGLLVTPEMIDSYLHGEEVFPEKAGFTRMFVNAENENISAYFWHIDQYHRKFILYHRGEAEAFLNQYISQYQAQLDDIDCQIVHEDPMAQTSDAASQ